MAWLVLVGVGLKAMASYEIRPGAPTHAPSQWPEQSGVALDPVKPTLVMFVHPKCACTKASLEELARVAMVAHGNVRMHIALWRPGRENSDGSNSAMAKAALQVPGAILHDDSDGALADRFGAVTSGSVVLYDPEGHLRFTGGITGSRGGYGENLAEDTLLSHITGGQSPVEASRTPAFGCSLRSPSIATPQVDEPPDSTSAQPLNRPGVGARSTIGLGR